jgi:anti-sigma B factor antagonist
MSIRVRAAGPVAIVQAERRLVVGNRQDLKTAVAEELENGRAGVVIDLGETDLIDSGGLGVLVTLHRHAEDVGSRLVLAGLCEELRELLRLTKLDTIFDISHTVEEGVAACAPDAAAVPPPPALAGPL